MPKMPLHTCRHIADCTRAQHVKNLNVSILLTTFQELFRHDLRNPCALREDHPIAVTYHLHGLFNRHRPCGKNLFSIHTRIFQWLLCLCFVINKSWDKIELPEGIRTLYVTFISRPRSPLDSSRSESVSLILNRCRSRAEKGRNSKYPVYRRLTRTPTTFAADRPSVGLHVSPSAPYALRGSHVRLFRTTRN